MAKVIKAGARKQHNEQNNNAFVADDYMTNVACDSDMPSSTASMTMLSSDSTPRNALVVIKKQVDIDRKMIEKAAYYKAQKRNFAPGNEVQDWLEAEAELGSLVS